MSDYKFFAIICIFFVLFIFIIGLGEKCFELEKRLNNEVCQTCGQILK